MYKQLIKKALLEVLKENEELRKKFLLKAGISEEEFQKIYEENNA